MLIYFIKKSISDIIRFFEIMRLQYVWRKLNPHNYTHVANPISTEFFPIEKVKVGKYSYGPLCVHSFGTDNENLVIGSFCSISFGVKFILGGNHSMNTFSTYPFRFYYDNKKNEAKSKGPIIIEDDVWIGTDSTILSGVKLGKGTIVAAGSIVTKSTLPYSLVGGNPAKLIKMRFEDSIIKKLMEIDFNCFNENNINSLLNNMYEPLSENYINNFQIKLKQSNK
jgi:acetyltransferase-like isoleucine patch superfamily enzyme